MQFFSLARLAATLAVTGTILAGCVVVDEGPGMRPPPPPGPPGRGDICTREYAPVCGENRGRTQTFGNACVARSEGFRIVHGGECRSEGRPTPPPGPQACTREYAPVCAERGRDRRSFGNACMANAEGYSIRHPGECRGGGGRWDERERGSRWDGRRG